MKLTKTNLKKLGFEEDKKAKTLSLELNDFELFCLLDVTKNYKEIDTFLRYFGILDKNAKQRNKQNESNISLNIDIENLNRGEFCDNIELLYYVMIDMKDIIPDLINSLIKTKELSDENDIYDNLSSGDGEDVYLGDGVYIKEDRTIYDDKEPQIKKKRENKEK